METAVKSTSRIILTKESSGNEIKNYFVAVLNLSQSNKEFPVNLDDVWPLVYNQKSDAVKALINNEQFIQAVDYKVLRQNPQNPEGGRPTIEYYLTTSCLEFFIARKVRSVFEVYRQVFHKAAQSFAIPKTFAEALRLAADQQEEIERQQVLIEQQKPKVKYFNDLVDRHLNINFRDTAKEIGLKQNDFIKRLLDAKQQQTIEEQQKQLVEQRPKVEFFDAVAENKTAIEMKAVANTLHFKNVGRNKLFEILRTEKILMQNNMPYQKYVDNGYFRTIEQKYATPDGEVRVSIKTLVYQKGVDYIRKVLKGKGFKETENV